MKMIIALLCLLPGIAFSATNNQPPELCPHNRFSCLEQNMDNLYLQDYNRFFVIYNKVFNEAMQCKSYKAVARYLTIHSASHDNAEVDEQMQADTEALLLLKPKCFFEGFLLLTPEQQENLVGSYHLFSRPNHVMKLLRKYMKGGKYKQIATEIYNANLDNYNDYGKNDQDAPMSDLYAKYGH